MRNIKLVLEYDGSRYQGWQRLGKDESTNTISNKIIEVIDANKEAIYACGEYILNNPAKWCEDQYHLGF